MWKRLRTRKKTAGRSGETISGRLVDARSDKSLVPALIEVWDTSDGNLSPLADSKVDRSAAFNVTIDTGSADTPRTLAVYVFDAEREHLLVREPTLVRLGDDPARDIVIHVDAPTRSNPIPTDIGRVQKRLRLELPRALTRYFESGGVRTLADLRLRGDLARDPNLPVAADDPALGTLQSLAALTLLPTDVSTNAALASAGMSDIIDVAHASTLEIQGALKDLPR